MEGSYDIINIDYLKRCVIKKVSGGGSWKPAGVFGDDLRINQAFYCIFFCVHSICVPITI